MNASASLRDRGVALLGALLSGAVFACGGKFDFTGGTGDAGGGREAPSRVESSDASTFSGDASAPSSESSITSVDATATNEAGDASGRVQVTLNYSPPSFIGLDCAPGAPDPVGVNVNVVFDSPAGQGPQAVTFPAARVKFTKGSRSLTWSFGVATEMVDPSPPPPRVVESLWNVPGSGSGEGTGVPCDYCGETAEFDLEVSSPGQSPYWTGGLSPVECQP